MGNTRKLATLERLAELGDKKRAIAKKARAAIALIQSKKDEIARDFYAIGRALVALDDEAVIAALGQHLHERDWVQGDDAEGRRRQLPGELAVSLRFGSQIVSGS